MDLEPLGVSDRLRRAAFRPDGGQNPLRSFVDEGQGLAVRRPRDSGPRNSLRVLVGCQHPLARAIERCGQQALLGRGVSRTKATRWPSGENAGAPVIPASIFLGVPPREGT